MTKNRILHRILTGLSLFILYSSAGQSTTESPEEANKPMTHAVSSEKLKDVMHRLNQLTFEKELAPMQLKEVRDRNIQELVSAIDELLVTAQELTDAVPGFRMTPEERDTFIEMAWRLKSEAYRLRYTAEVGNNEELDLAYQRLDHTCLTCHQLFRF